LTIAKAWQMHARPALTVLDRLRLTVLARIALDRAAFAERRGRHVA
jgi:hypothetical protein